MTDMDGNWWCTVSVSVSPQSVSVDGGPKWLTVLGVGVVVAAGAVDPSDPGLLSGLDQACVLSGQWPYYFPGDRRWCG